MQRLGRVVLVLMVTATVTVAAAPPAAACSCSAGSGSDVRGRLAKADAAFVGTFIMRNDPLANEQGATGARIVINQFDVETAPKGQLGETVEVISAADERSCGIPARQGERMGLLLTAGPGGFRSDLCSRVDADALEAAGGGRLEGLEIVVAAVAGLALVGVVAATALGPGRDAALH